MSKPTAAEELREILTARHSSRIPFDPARPVATPDLQRILEAASWASTAHNMQNFEMLVVDDPARLATIAAISSKLSATFLRENFRQLSFSQEELRRKKTGVLAAMFPPAWSKPGADFDALAAAAPPQKLAATMQNCPTLLLVLYDSTRRAPASEGDVLGFISLGCVMQNMWLMAQTLGIGLQIMSVFSNDAVEGAVKRALGVPAEMKIAYACRLGYPPDLAPNYVRVRRDVADFAHRNDFGTRGLG